MVGRTGQEKELWVDYNRDKKNGNGLASRNKLIEYYLPWAKRVVGNMCLASLVDRENLFGEGIVKLIGAFDKYDESYGVNFKTYAEHRIKGAVLDACRKIDFVRSIRIAINQVNCAKNVLYKRFNCDPDEYQILEELAKDKYVRAGVKRKNGVNAEDKARRIYEDGTAFVGHCKLMEGSRDREGNIVGYLGALGDESNRFLFDAEKRELEFFVDGMDLRDRTLWMMYYGKELSMKEIGKRIGYAEARVSQIHSKIVKRLKSKVNKMYLNREHGESFVLGVLNCVIERAGDEKGFFREKKG